ncbi:MAG: hypothetical protein IKE22_05200 [Atopobiaceae bacterium]|nr:hypothetical protein [Atopobiaceae bacterium]
MLGHQGDTGREDEGVYIAEDPINVREYAEGRFRTWALSDSAFARILFLCAEVGMGKTWLSQSLLDYLKKRGAFVRYESLASTKSERVARHISKIAREMREAKLKTNDKKALVIDDVPPLDECDLAKVCRALDRLVQCNTLVIVCLLPEAAMLQEEFPKAPTLFSSNLVELLDGGDSEDCEPTDHRVFVQGSCASLVRSSLLLEEQRLRLAMMLLGHGTFDELSSIVEKLDYDMLGLMKRDAPMFLVDRSEETFIFPTLLQTEDLVEHVEELRLVCMRLHETTVLAARVLAGRESFERAAVVCGMCPDADLAFIATTYGVELICAGYLPTVSKALELSEELSLSPSLSQQLSKLAIHYLCDPASKLDEGPIPGDRSNVTHRERQQIELVTLLRACRDLDRGRFSGRIPLDAKDGGYYANLIVLHLRARHLIISGEPTEAYSLLVNSPERLRPQSFVEALLCDDFEMAQMLTGEMPRREERLANVQARKVMARSGVSRLVSYQRLLQPMLMVLVGRVDTFEGSEMGITLAERMGDNLVRAVFLITSAVLDNRRGAYARAHVRGLQATEALGGARDRYLMLVARLICALSSFALGDNTALESIVQYSSASHIRDLAAFMLCRKEDDATTIELSTLLRSACTRDVVWLLNMLCNDFGESSLLYTRMIPSPWSALSRRSVRFAQAAEFKEKHEERVKSERSIARLGATTSGKTLAAAPKRGGRVHIQLLGNLRITCGSTTVSPERLRKRKGHALLVQLAAHRHHSLTRYDLVESIWPELDYAMGLQRLYEATSAVRITLKDAGCKKDPFLVVRGEGIVAFDRTAVRCDVDEFERAVHAAFSTDGDETIIELACDAMNLYHGDLCEMPFDSTGFVEARRQELKDLYVDTAVAGASAALRIGQLPLAVHMANAAYEANGLREDAASTLIEALKASGRIVDAREVYRSFAAALLEATGEPPSPSLRASVSSLFPQRKSSRRGRSTRGSGGNAETDASV